MVYYEAFSLVFSVSINVVLGVGGMGSSCLTTISVTWAISTV